MSLVNIKSMCCCLDTVGSAEEPVTLIKESFFLAGQKTSEENPMEDEV